MENNLAKQYNAKSLLKFSLPTIIMMVFMSLYTIVDGMFVARFVSTDAVAAVNVVFPAILLFMGLGIMISVGGSALIAKKMGEQKDKEAREDFTLVTLISVVIALVGTAVCIGAMEPILKLLGATEILMPYCKDYFFVMSIGMPLMMFQILFQNFFITAGKPRLGLILVVAAGVTNMLLDYILIAVFDMGIKGAAIATVIGYSLPTVIGLIMFSIPKGTLYFTKPKWRTHTVFKSITNGSSEMVTNLAAAVITLMLNRIMLGLAGEDGVASISIIMYIQQIFTSILFGYAIGVSPVVGYKYGARDNEQLKKVFKICLWFIAICSAVVLILVYSLAPYLVQLFAKKGTEAYDLAYRGFLLFSVSFLFTGINIFASAHFTALNNGKISALLSFLRTFVFVLVSLLVLPKFWGTDGVFIAIPIAEALAFLFSFAFLFAKRKKYQYA